MNAQKYPSSIIKKGATLYESIYYIDDNGKAKVETRIYCVRSVQKKRNALSDQPHVNITMKIDGVTWGKRSTKIGDYGWLSSIPRVYVKQFREGDKLPYGIYTTKLAALKFAIATLKDEVEFDEQGIRDAKNKNDIKFYTSELEENNLLLKAARTRLKREQNKR